MNKIVKFSLLGAGTVIGIAVVIAAYLAATFNPNDYKEQIIQAVKQSKHRTLHLDGDIKLSFFPRIGANLGKLSLSDFNSDKQFAEVDAARVSLALMPLLSGHVLVNEVTVSGLTATLIKHKDGTSNIEDLLSKDDGPKGNKQPVNFDIASVSIEKTNLTYRDEGTGAQYAIRDLNLHTGRLANGVPVKISLSVGVQGNQPKLDITTKLKTTLTFDLDRQFYQMEDMDLQVGGAVTDVSNLKLKVSGDASANLSTQEYTANKFRLNATGQAVKNNFDATLDAPALSWTQEKISGNNLTLNAQLDGAIGKVVAVLSLPEISGNAQGFKISALALDMDMKQPEQAFKIKLSSPVSGNFETRQFNLNNLTLAVNATGDRLPKKSVNSELKGSVQIDGTRQIVKANLAGGLLQSQLKAKVAVNGFSNPSINFDVDVDQFDADLYLPKKVEKANQSEQPFDLSALRALNLDGSLRIGQLKVANIKSSGVRLDIKAHQGRLSISPLSANLYQGSMNGSVSVNALAVPVIAINESLKGIDVAALTRDAAGFDTLEGRGNVVMNVSMQGNTTTAMKRAMDGNFSLNLVDGAIKGINVAKSLRDAQSMLGKTQTQAANQSEKTDFSELKASFKIINGVAHNNDLFLKSPLLRVSGAGDINIGNDSMNYLAKATLVKTLEGQGGKDNLGGITVPVRVAGPFGHLQYTLDVGSMVEGVARQKVEAKKEEIKTRLKDQLQNSLKGMFR